MKSGMKSRLKKLRNKEFVIFGGVVCTIALVFIVVGAIKSVKPYSGDDVVVNFGANPGVHLSGFEDDEYPEDVEEAKKDTTVYPDDWVSGDRINILTDEELASLESYGEDAPGASEIEGDEFAGAGATNDETEYVDEGQNQAVEKPHPGVVLRDPPPMYERPSGEEYISMVLHWVCGIPDDMYNTWLSGKLRDEFGERVNKEPYASLNGNTVYKNISTPTDQRVTFVAGDGNTYKFEVNFNGDYIDSIEPY